MQKKPPALQARVLPFAISLGVLGFACGISYFQPSCVATMMRENDGSITCELKQYMLFLVPIAEKHFRNVEEVKLHHASRSDATIELRAEDGSIRLRSTFFFKEKALQDFLTNRSRPDLTFRTTPNLIFVAPIAGLGVLVLVIAIACESQRLFSWKSPD